MMPGIATASSQPISNARQNTTSAATSATATSGIRSANHTKPAESRV